VQYAKRVGGRDYGRQAYATADARGIPAAYAVILIVDAQYSEEGSRSSNA